MAEFINGVESEVLTLFESDNIPYIQNIESVLSSGTYVKLTNREYLFLETSRAYSREEITPLPTKYGYVNNTETLNFTVEYYEE
jgi:hypothetical protein